MCKFLWECPLKDRNVDIYEKSSAQIFCESATYSPPNETSGLHLILPTRQRDDQGRKPKRAYVWLVIRRDRFEWKGDDEFEFSASESRDLWRIRRIKKETSLKPSYSYFLPPFLFLAALECMYFYQQPTESYT